MTCAHIQAEAAGLASLPPDDPERQAAEAHALSCRDCAAALREGQALMHLLGEAAPLPAPRPEALRRASAEIIAELRASRRLGALWAAGLMALVSVVASLLLGAPGVLAASQGIRCMAVELAMALPLFAVGYWWVRDRASVTPPILAAGGGALLGQALLLPLCHAGPTHAHLLVFHTGGVLVALALALVASRVLPAVLRR